MARGGVGTIGRSRAVALCLVLLAGVRAEASAQANGLLPSFLSGGFHQTYINNRPLSLDVEHSTTFFVSRIGRQGVAVRVGAPSTAPLKVMAHSDGSISPFASSDCGSLDAYNFVSVVIHRAPEFIDENSKWSAVVPFQFVDCSGANVKLPVEVTVERLTGTHLQLHVVGKKGGPIKYEGGPSSTHLTLDLRMQFVDGKFFECDGTVLEDLDSVRGHSAWILIPYPS